MAEVTDFVDWLPQSFRPFATIPSHVTIRVCAGCSDELFGFHCSTQLYRVIIMSNSSLRLVPLPSFSSPTGTDLINGTKGLFMSLSRTKALSSWGAL